VTAGVTRLVGTFTCCKARRSGSVSLGRIECLHVAGRATRRRALQVYAVPNVQHRLQTRMGLRRWVADATARS